MDPQVEKAILIADIESHRSIITEERGLSDPIPSGVDVSVFSIADLRKEARRLKELARAPRGR